ncbi:hypothetical protein PL8927_140086 [Planktothrix serta PCC 8927]|uniref:Uncharacterized protein n=1 Tax=Planktothrix serta PCC 8927 TaxID=671068 RepID=A0A7Z9BF06_9CYAN|nr:hypothetical protein [Planktothrix serta]VXD11277.1 hypothetical protein PL8927_140086 [Planktothrix serta PCC 8927]
MITLRWEFAKYRIAKALALRAGYIKDRIGQEDFQYLLEKKIISQESVELIIEEFPIFQTDHLSLEDIRSYYVETKQYCNLQEFLDGYLTIKFNSRGIWDNFRNGNGIRESAFKLFCEFLGENWQEIGSRDQLFEDLPDFEQLEIVLCKLDHNSQIECYKNFCESPLIGFKIPNFQSKKSNYNLYLFWLFKTFFKSIDQQWQTIHIDFDNTLVFCNRQETIKKLIYEIGMPTKNLNKKIDKGSIKAQEIAEEIIEALKRDKRNIIISIKTSDLNQVKDLDEFVRYMDEPLIQRLKKLDGKLFKPKIVFVWLDLASCPTSSNVELFQNEIPIVSHFSKTDVINWIEEQNIITKMSKWRKELNFPEDPEKFLEEIWRKSDVIIPDNSDMIKPEMVLEIFYKFILNNWENYKQSWLKL